MRSVEIANLHPRLQIVRGEIVQAIEVLDASFRFAAADLPHLTRSGAARARRQLKLTGDRAAIPGPGPAGELSIVFLSDEALAFLHARFLNDPSCTDVITFEGNGDAGSAGEICVSADTAARYAAEHERDFSEELTLYVVHGWLHLVGYDDLKPVKKRRMRAAEARALELLRAAAAMPVFHLRKPSASRK